MSMKAAKALPILMYHHVSPAPGLVTVSPAVFRGHMAALAAAGWRTVGLDEVERFYRGEEVPERTCVITFDDGYLDNFIYAYPILRELGMKAVLFIVTGWLGDGGIRDGSRLCLDHSECKRLISAGDADTVMLRWSEVEAMQHAGVFEFHSHTHTHVRWDQQIEDREARRRCLNDDLAHSRTMLAARLGSHSPHLCWPQGYFDDEYVQVARSAGFNFLYTTNKSVNTPTSSSLSIGRIVTKERSGQWATQRVALYARPWLGGLYTFLQGKR